MKIQTLYELPNRLRNPAAANLMHKVNKGALNLMYPRLARPRRGIDPSSDIVVSLTSFPGRIHSVWITVVTLLNQTVKPRAILLWLSRDQFPNGEADLPQSLRELLEYGLTVRFCDNLFPHKKYFYAMQDFPDSPVVTVDDDILYPENLIESLAALAKRFPGAIACTWAHEIALNPDRGIAPYGQWRQCVPEGGAPSLRLMPVGCGGVWYPPRALDARAFDKAAIRRLCLYADDLWLKCMAVLAGTPAVRWERSTHIFYTLVKLQTTGLFHENIGLDKNDEALNNILKEYPQVESILRRATADED